MAEDAKPARLTADECRAKAQECRRLAASMPSPDQKRMLLDMAEAWERMTDNGGQQT